MILNLTISFVEDITRFKIYYNYYRMFFIIVRGKPLHASRVNPSQLIPPSDIIAHSEKNKKVGSQKRAGELNNVFQLSGPNNTTNN